MVDEPLIEQLDRIIDGDLEEIITALRTYRQAALLNQVNGGPANGLFAASDDEADA